MTGFIDRQGKFYRCGYSEHDKTAIALFGKQPEFLHGFIKVWHGEYWIIDEYACCRLSATDEQLKTLVDLGIELDFDDLERWKQGI